MRVVMLAFFLIGSSPSWLVSQLPPRGRMPRDTAMRMAPDTTKRRAPIQNAMMQAMTGPLGIPMMREGSGTSGLPDASTKYALQGMTRGR